MKHNKAAKLALGKTGFVAHRRDLIESSAWLTMPVPTSRLIQFLEIEHLRHGGRQNGELCAPYNQLVAFGLGRRFIKPAIDDAIARGLLLVSHRGGWYPGAKADPSRYRITYLAWVLHGATGPEWLEPTNEWRAYQPSQKVKRRRKPRPPILRVIETSPIGEAS